MKWLFVPTFLQTLNTLTHLQRISGLGEIGTNIHTHSEATPAFVMDTRRDGMAMVMTIEMTMEMEMKMKMKMDMDMDMAMVMTMEIPRKQHFEQVPYYTASALWISIGPV